MRNGINESVFAEREQNLKKVDVALWGHKQQISSTLMNAISFDEFSENVEKMYATSIVMSSRDCASGTCD